MLNEQRAFEIMEKHQVDVLITSFPQNVTYITDIPLLHPFLSATQVFAVLPLGRDLGPTLIIPTVAVDMWADSPSQVKDVICHGSFYFFKNKETNMKELSPGEARLAKLYFKQMKEKPERDVVTALVRGLKDKGLTDVRFGLDEQLPSLQMLDEITRVLPHAQIKKAAKIFREIRMVKTGKEIQLMKKAAMINEEGLKTILGAVKERITEKKLYQIFRSVLVKKDAHPVMCVICGGTRGALTNGQPSDYKLKKGDSIRFDLEITHQYYDSDVARIAVIGSPTEKLVKYQNAILEGIKQGEEAIRPGVKASHIFHVMLDTIKTVGIPHYNRQHCGHGLGMGGYNDPLLSPSDETPLEEGMVLNIEAPYYEIGWGCAQVEDTILVTKSGFERIQRSPRELYVL